MSDQWMKRGLAALPAALLVAASVVAVPASAQECEVKIGAAGPSSGGAAAFGLAQQAAAEFVATMVNAEGGLAVGDKKCSVKVFPYDSKYTASGGAAAANYFASEGIHAGFILASVEAAGFRPVAARAGIVAFNTAYSKDAITPEFPLLFHASVAPVSFGAILVKAAQDQFKFKSVIVVGANMQGGTEAAEALSKFYTANGATFTAEYYQQGTTNFAPVAQRIMNANPDAIEISTMGPADAELFLKQLFQAGYEGVIGSLGGAGLPPIAAAAGGEENLKNVYWLQLVPTDDPGIVKMNADYKKLMGKEPPTNALFGVYVPATEVLLNAISKAGTDQDGEKIADALRSTTPKSRYMGEHGWRGKAIYGINNELSFPIGLGVIADGKKLPSRTVEIPAEE